MARRVIFSADDFGLSPAVNEAVEQAYRHGILTTASLMVAGPAHEDAIDRALRMPGLRVGLHVVVIEGAAALPSSRLTDGDGWIPSDQLRLSLRYAFSMATRRDLRAEIAAQFAAFGRTGLRLDHANAHKHMHLHPVVGRMIIQEGARYRLPAIRIPREPTAVLRACGEHPGLGAPALAGWTGSIRRQARRAGLATNDHAFGIAWSGHMTKARLLQLLPLLPPGVSEIYCHPATHADARLLTLMPGYEPAAELQALLSPAVKAAMIAAEIVPATYDTL